MATRLAPFANLCKNQRVSTLLQTRARPLVNTTRCLSERCTTIPGTIPAAPLKQKFSLPQVTVFISIGVFVGQYLAKTFAAFLEETEMFVPEDDDD